MLSFVSNWFAPKSSPIGVDFGSDCLRMAQVAPAGNGEWKLLAAASADVPIHVRNNFASRIQFFVETTRDLLAQGGFRTKSAVLGLPASFMHILHVRTPKLDEEETRKSLPFEIVGKLPFDPSQALLRHLIAGEVYQEQDPKNEVIVMAAAKEMVNQLLAAAARARLDVIGMNVEPKALVDCFGQVYRRKSDQEQTTCYVDIGCAGTRVTIARGTQIFFARAIPIAGDHFNRATAAAMKISFEQAKMLRIKLAVSGGAGSNGAGAEEPQQTVPQHAPVPQQPARAPRVVPQAEAPAVPEQDENNTFALLDAAISRSNHAAATATAPAPAAAPVAAPTAVRAPAPAEQHNAVGSADPEAAAVAQACREPLHKLIDELNLCRRYYEATFQNKPVDRLVFVGGEARHRGLCQTIARELGLAAQIGDPLVRVGRNTDLGIESGIDRRQPQPGWAVAIGLSMGPSGGAEAK